MNKSKIDWCDMTWNPVTGCFHGCEYCYARKMATRFADPYVVGHDGLYVLSDKAAQYVVNPKKDENGRIFIAQKDPIFRNDGLLKPNGKSVSAYPFGFLPTLHEHRLDEPARNKKPQTIFVCSMADLFGDWVPDEWIKSVFEATNKAPQHTYLYLTKNPDRYYQLADGDENIIPDDGISGWFGASASTEEQAQSAWENLNCRWISIEPIHGEFSEEFFTHDYRYTQQVERRWDWIVVGSETGNRKDKVVPEKKWVHDLYINAVLAGTPVFMKESLRGIMGHHFVQEFSEGVKLHG